MSPSARLAVGLGLPVLLVVATVPLLSRLHLSWLGLPVAAWWLFGCIPVVSACLYVCWLSDERGRSRDRSS